MAERVAEMWVRNKSDEAAVDKGCTFDLAAADRVRTFCSRFLRHSKGQWAGKPFEFMDWQWQRFVAPLFGWKMPDGTRRFRRAGVGIAKKNGKSATLSALSLYLLCADGEAGAEIYSAAADRDQASIIYNEAANMVDASPALKSRLKVRRSGKRIEFPQGKATYKALSAESTTKEGLNIHGLLFDELHAQRHNRELWDTLRYGGRARRQPLYLWITTAGEHDETHLWYEQWQHALDVQESRKIDISFLPCIYAASRTDDWTSPETWRKANPALGITVNERQIAEECEAAKINPAEKIAFLRYTLNISTAADSEWIDPQFWHACRADYTLRDLRGAECYGSLDLASTTDLIAYMLVFRKADLVYLWPYFWVPKREVDRRDKANKQRYDQWIAQGFMTVTSEEPVADYNVIRKDILRICRQVDTAKLIIDRWNATQLAYDLRKSLRRRGFSTKLQFANFNFRTASAATKEMERLIISNRLKHPGNPVLDWMFGNVIIQTDALGNRRPDRGKSKDKIDGIAAAVLGLAVMMEEQREASKYETKGLYSADDPASGES